MDNNANTQDAWLILQLRAMCCDPDMHSARLWWRNSFWPETVDDYLKVEAALGTPENAWLGQVISYWGMAAALVAQGTLGEHALLSAVLLRGVVRSLLQAAAVSCGSPQVYTQARPVAQHRGIGYWK